LTFAPDGRLVAASGNSVLIWTLETKPLLRMAERSAGRNLSLEEWQQFFNGEPYHRTFPSLPDGRGAAEVLKAGLITRSDHPPSTAGPG
jgi:hypothetical protein